MAFGFGAITVAKLQAILDADTRSFTRKMHEAEGKTEKFGHVAKAALIGGAAAGVTALGVAAKIGWDEFNAGQRVAAQTAAALKSTGGVAGITAKHVSDLANSMLHLTGIDDEATQSAENQLLTFTKIGAKGGVFDRATQATADLATRLNGGAIPSFEQMNQTAIMVGKGLNNPISGLTRLQRVGVEFTDKQKEQITALAESGKTLDAQRIILKALEQQYGGSAKAAGETFGGQLIKAREIMNNFLGDLVGKAIPYLQRLGAWIETNWPKVQQAWSNTIATMREAWKKWGDEIKVVIHAVVPIVRSGLRVIASIFRLIGALLRGDWSDVWTQIKNIVKNELSFIKAIVTGWFSVAKTLGAKLGGALKDGIISGVKGIGSSLAGLVKSALNAVIGLWNRLPSFTIHGPGPLPDFTVGFPDIPTLARGGIVTRPTLALIGERGPEAVVPLGRGMGVTINYHTLISDPRDGEKLVRILEQWQRRGGR